MQAPPPLVLVDATIVTSEDVPATIDLVTTGGDGSPVTFVIDGTWETTLGVVDVVDEALTFTPKPDALGVEAGRNLFPYQDGVPGQPGKLSFTVQSVDDGPRVSVTGPFDAGAGAARVVYASATDREDDDITWSATFPAGEVAVLPGDRHMAQFDVSYAGGAPAPCTITATDDAGASTDVVVTIP